MLCLCNHAACKFAASTVSLILACWLGGCGGGKLPLRTQSYAVCEVLQRQPAACMVCVPACVAVEGRWQHQAALFRTCVVVLDGQSMLAVTSVPASDEATAVKQTRCVSATPSCAAV